jgi:hypothetical protein
VNEKPTNALTIQHIGTQYSSTCFGILKCHHQGLKLDHVEIGGRPSRRLLQYTASILICFPQHWAPISAASFLTP